MTAVQSGPVPPHEVGLQTPQLPRLRFNRGKNVDLPSTGWMVPTPKDTPLEKMRKRYDETGYLWIKHLLPREDVYDMREHYFSFLSPSGILLPNTSPRDGIFNSTLDPMEHQGLGGDPEKAHRELLDAVHATPEYEKFLTHPDLRTFVRRFMDWEREILVKRALLRHNCPGSESTGIHYDQLFLRGGEPDFLTAWIPIGDCDATGGGLMYLENSTPLGQQIEAQFTQNAQSLPPSERISAFNAHMGSGGFLTPSASTFSQAHGHGTLRWLVGNYAAGDVVFHNPWMVHAATSNEDRAGRIRLASDLRFYGDERGVDGRWMKGGFRFGDGL